MIFFNFSYQDRKVKGLPDLDTTAGQQHSFTGMRDSTSGNTVAQHISQCVLNDLLEVSYQMIADFFKIRSGEKLNFSVFLHINNNHLFILKELIY